MNKIEDNIEKNAEIIFRTFDGVFIFQTDKVTLTEDAYIKAYFANDSAVRNTYSYDYEIFKDYKIFVKTTTNSVREILKLYNFTATYEFLKLKKSIIIDTLHNEKNQTSINLEKAFDDAVSSMQKHLFSFESFRTKLILLGKLDASHLIDFKNFYTIKKNVDNYD